jgi:uncharacterized protein YqgC (DUF456 family)
METVLIIIGLLMLAVGIIGCIAPGLPGPPISYLALILLQFTGDSPVFSYKFMVLWGLLVLAVSILDYYVPIWGTKKFGGSKFGVWGSIIGLIIGLFAGPFGIIIGTFIGAYAGELIGGMNNKEALRAGFGAFLGFVAGTIMKLSVSLILSFFFLREAWALIRLWFQ